jgi:protein FAM50
MRADEMISVTYSYYDGTGHRRTVIVRKGTKIDQFLELVRQEFHELRGISAENMLFIKEDVIIPHVLTPPPALHALFLLVNFFYCCLYLCLCLHYTEQDYSFYDLVVTKAKGKSGPLWNWDVHDDIRLLADATKEKDESHAAKVVERRWYERNKHIFPASRWEVYDPNVKRDRYTIHGDEVNKS